ncbi:MAG: hypothetical protein HFH34_03155 [Eubacterium sp.]|nr:hypothetical protein [Eubacterium sp.]
MDQETAYLKKRLTDLSRRAEQKNIVTFSHFLNLNELNILHQSVRELHSSFETFGGYEQAERQMAAFIPDALSYVWEYPVRTVRLAPSHRKFAEDLTHRDVLGALMHLGIKRETLGDILLPEDGIYVFCADAVADYLTDNCTKIRHTTVTAALIDAQDFHYEPKRMEKDGIVASLRLDTVLADVCKLSRSAAQKRISEGSAFLNSKKILQNDYLCQEGDLLSVRHYGKFQIQSVGQVTKKGRIKYRYDVFV